jgi:hypothetical protein
MLDVYDYFTVLRNNYPFLGPFISDTAAIVHSPDFEKYLSAIIKIQRGAEDSLSEDEKTAVECFLLPEEDHENDSGSATDFTIEEQFARLKRRRLNLQSKYILLTWICPASDIVERFFSKAKLGLTDLRKSMLPVTLESILFLKVHMEVWANTSFVSKALKGEDEEVEESDEDDYDNF